ncbi:hypothetical protein QBC46DRAFT_376061 [Diplogelasinospora grovesii]|uniref:Pre-mRNA-splicing factor CWC24 n=1 Tax=Diplogelasinospora grovesii TaxID=303347 RepID=A0AAN6NE03_9PEZI|nr:hypothetical protein QBC46DRAFT_376061 [Diplogelasinospora grovesii]
MSSAISESTPESRAPAAPVAIFKKRGAKAKANIRKRDSTPPPAAVVASDDDDFSSSEDESGPRTKRIKTKASVTASSNDQPAHRTKDLYTTTFVADKRFSSRAAADDATKQSNWYDDPVAGNSSSDKETTGESIRATSKTHNGDRDTASRVPDGTYKGLANQAKYIERNPNAPKRTVGPVKAPTNIRTITITDMAPDVCKDYKQTGFCGFGDSCKFLHAREDYKHGWQLDKEWETVTKGKKALGGTIVASVDRKSNEGEEDDDAEAAMLENIPFACIICKGPYQSPVMTRCGHYFCESCALKRYRKDPSCAACGAGTNGVFNSAKRLQKLLEKKRVKQRQEQADDTDSEGDNEGDEA